MADDQPIDEGQPKQTLEEELDQFFADRVDPFIAEATARGLTVVVVASYYDRFDRTSWFDKRMTGDYYAQVGTVEEWRREQSAMNVRQAIREDDVDSD